MEAAPRLEGCKDFRNLASWSGGATDKLHGYCSQLYRCLGSELRSFEPYSQERQIIGRLRGPNDYDRLRLQGSFQASSHVGQANGDHSCSQDHTIHQSAHRRRPDRSADTTLHTHSTPSLHYQDLKHYISHHVPRERDSRDLHWSQIADIGVIHRFSISEGQVPVVLGYS